jgi:hypothetical protein
MPVSLFFSCESPKTGLRRGRREDYETDEINETDEKK